MTFYKSNASNNGAIKLSELGGHSVKTAIYIMKARFCYWLFAGMIGFGWPYMLFDLLSGVLGRGYASRVKEISTAKAVGLGVEELLLPVADFLSYFLGAGLLAVIWWSCGYFVLIRLAEAHILNKSLPHWGRLSIQSLAQVIRRVLPFVMIVGLLFLLFQGFFLGILVLVCLCLFAPVFLCLEQPRIGTALRGILTLSYARAAIDRRILVLFQVVSYGSIVLIVMAVIDWFHGAILDLDRLGLLSILPRDYFLAMVPGLNLPVVYILALGFKATAMTIVATGFALFSTIFYLQIQDFSVRLEGPKKLLG